MFLYFLAVREEEEGKFESSFDVKGDWMIDREQKKELGFLFEWVERKRGSVSFFFSLVAEVSEDTFLV